jgi:hypothetical protein
MNLFKRFKISPKKVRKAYLETGIIPAQRTFHEDNKACAFGVLAYASGNDTGIIRWAYHQFGSSFSDGFMNGFDGFKKDSILNHETGEYNKGFKNGRAVWRKVKNLAKEKI